MTTATAEQQRSLLALQEVDTAIRQFEHRRAHLPEQQELNEHEETLRKVAVELSTNEEDLGKTERLQTRLEGEISAVDARRKSEEGRMYSGQITSEKELSAIRNELGALKGRKADLEDQLLEMMERREELEGLVAELRDRREELTAKVAELSQARDVAATGIDAELQKRAAERTTRAAVLPPELLSLYDALRERKQGLAVVELQGRTCSGCRIELTAIELEDVRAQAQGGLPRCEQCERILLVASG
jgi:uncharacterized protein